MSTDQAPRPLAVVTGATSGIGRSFAGELARRGHDLLLTGRRREKLDAVAAELRRTCGVAVDLRIIELTNREAMLAFVGEVSAHESVAVLVNNAGYGRSSAFHADDVEAEAGMVTVHVETALRLTHAVIPGMQRRGAGWIINVSSLAAHLPLPRGAVYASTKAWMIRFSESVALELSGTGVRCQALLPGFTRTDFHREPQYDSLDRRNRGLVRWMEPDEVVRASLRDIERGRRIVCVPGASNRMLSAFMHLIPRRLLYRLIERNRPLQDGSHD